MAWTSSDAQKSLVKALVSRLLQKPESAPREPNDFAIKAIQELGFDEGDKPKIARFITRIIPDEHRYGGVEVSAVATAAAGTDGVARFASELRARVAGWEQAGKQGLWLTIPTAAAACIGPAVELGFDFHHAKPGYALLTRWLPSTPSSLPVYGFTQIGVGGVVVNAAGHVLMVVEKVSPMAQMQGQWKLPGGLADPGEDFGDTVAREVREETGVSAALEGVVSLRHSHGYRFGQVSLTLPLTRTLALVLALNPAPILSRATSTWWSRCGPRVRRSASTRASSSTPSG